jgi:hypothetical protein
LLETSPNGKNNLDCELKRIKFQSSQIMRNVAPALNEMYITLLRARDVLWIETDYAGRVMQLEVQQE